MFTALDVTLDINPNEVSDAKYVSKEELEAMFADESEFHCPRVFDCFVPMMSERMFEVGRK
jgi:isopentenyldiphosphate isomerase